MNRNIQSGPGDQNHPCAEPNCGELPEDHFGGGALTQQQKNASNKQAKEQAKANKDKLENSIRNDPALWDILSRWIRGASIDLGFDGWIKITTPGGTQIEGKGCVQYHGKLNPDSPEAKDYCVDRKADTETIKKADGKYETQLNLTYRIFNRCYWEKTCGVETITFVAGSMNELASFVNETLGEAFL